jgi:hypothetical protein
MIEIPDTSRTSVTEYAREALSVPDGEKLAKFYVVVTHVTRHYGGPEEGGWWYDWTSIEDVRKVFGAEGVLKALEKLGEEYPRSRYGRGSVLGDAGDYEFAVCISQEEFPEETKERPTYG